MRRRTYPEGYEIEQLGPPPGSAPPGTASSTANGGSH
jgi:hypothetical protein